MYSFVNSNSLTAVTVIYRKKEKQGQQILRKRKKTHICLKVLSTLTAVCDQYDNIPPRAQRFNCRSFDSPAEEEEEEALLLLPLVGSLAFSRIAPALASRSPFSKSIQKQMIKPKPNQMRRVKNAVI